MRKQALFVLALSQIMAVLIEPSSLEGAFGISAARAQQQPPPAQTPSVRRTPPQDQPSAGQQQRPSPSQGQSNLMLSGQNRLDANAGTVTILTARTPTGTITQATLDLSTLLDKGEFFEEMRVIPIISRGKMQNLWDLLHLKSVDAGFLQTDTLEFLKDDPQVASIKNRLRYIVSMFPEEVHVIARAEIKTLQDLAGKKISVNAKGTGSALTMPIILKRLGIDAIIENEDPNRAVERMKQGDLVAHTFVFGKPTAAVSNMKGEGFHLIPIPYTQELFDLYVPITFTHKDYPNLVPPDQEVESVAVGNVLAVFNWPEASDRYKKVARFVDAFFEKFEDLHKPGFHQKWKEVNIAASVTGWTRFKAAQQWLDKNKDSIDGPPAITSKLQSNTDLRKEFEIFLQERANAKGVR